jgi:hypothetical protein
MKDQRGPAIRSLTERGGHRHYWRYEHKEPDESAGLWYFECARSDDEWWCIRQIAPHPGGVSAYDWQHLEDEHGFLTDQPIDEHEPLLEAIPAEEFEASWREAVQRRAGPH